MYVRVRVTAGARKETIARIDETTVMITVREPAARNLANRRVRELLAQEYGTNEYAVRLVSGHRSPNKVFDIELPT